MPAHLLLGLAIFLTGWMAALQASDVRLTFDDFGGPAVTVRDPSGAALSAPEPLIRWAEKSNLRSRKEAAAGWWVELGPPGLTAQVSPPRTGEYGEFLFEIRL